jgi:hypothetical protein
MKIIADIEGKKVIEQLCDIALKHGGMQNLQAIQLILENVTDIPEVKEETNEK